ncbi:hypothetical protein ACXIVC_21825 [Vibrio parahaemolyticus]
MISNEDLNTFNQDVVRLCEATTNLHAEISGQKARLESKVKSTQANAEEAKQHTTSANDSRNSAMNAEISAHGYASRAEIAAERAEQVAGLDTVSEAVSQALDDVGLDIPSEADMHLMIQSNRDLFAASGFVEWGKHKGASVNQGITTYASSQYWIDQFACGNPDGHGVSKTVHPILHMGGFTAQPIGINRTDEINALKLPPAPDGCTVTDMGGDCRGSGKTTLNLLTDIDPKYGNVADSENEAVARAFEGIIKNGDFRDAETEWRTSLVDSAVATFGDHECAISVKAGEANAGQRVVQNVSVEANRTYVLKAMIHIDRADSNPRVQLYGFDGNPVVSKRPRNLKMGKWQEITVRYQAVTDGSIEVQLQNNSDVDSTVKFSTVSFSRTAEEVIINRFDLVGYEAFLEEITPSNPTVFKGGFIQSRPSNIKGINTDSDESRPDSYFAAFTGDKSSRGYGVNWFTASKSQKERILSSPRINIFRMNDGKIVQLRVRQRSFAGLGNRPFAGVNSAIHGSLAYAGTGMKAAVKPQGATEDDTAYTGVSPYFYGSRADQHKNLYPYERGVFCASQYNGGAGGLDGALSVDGRVFFLPVCYVQRLNQGCYDPAYNPLGTSRCAGSTNGETVTGRSMWHDSNSDKPRGTARCFHAMSDGDKTNCGGGYYSGHKGTLQVGASGRYDDNKYFDSIYASMIHDLRLSAHVQDVNKLKEHAMKNACSGELRGKESPYFTWTGHIVIHDKPVFDGGVVKFISATTESRIPHRGRSAQYFKDDGISAFVQSPVSGKWHKLTRFFTEEDSDGVGSTYLSSEAGDVSDDFSVAGRTELKVIVSTNDVISAEFERIPHVAVIGTHEEISNTFPDGVIGRWVNVDLDGTSKAYPLLHKHIGSSLGFLSTSDSGASWNYSFQPNSAQDFSETRNEVVTAFHESKLRLYFVDGLAKQTEPANNTEVFGAIDYVFGSSHNSILAGCRLQQSLIGEVGKGSSSYLRGYSAVTNYIFGSSNLIHPHADLHPKHLPIYQVGSGSDNGSKAVKALATVVDKDGLLYLQMHGCEMVYSHDAPDGVDKWGDVPVPSSPLEQPSGAVPIIDGEGTKTDLNGKLVRTFCHHSIFPIGWASESRASQTPS